MKAKPHKVGEIVCTVSKEDADKLISIGETDDTNIIVEAAIKALTKIRLEKKAWWEMVYEKYGLPRNKPGVVGYMIDMTTGQVSENLVDDVPAPLATPLPPGSAA